MGVLSQHNILQLQQLGLCCLVPQNLGSIQYLWEQIQEILDLMFTIPNKELEVEGETLQEKGHSQLLDQAMI